MFTCLYICAFPLMCVSVCTQGMLHECACEDSELNSTCCLFSALQGQEMFTAVYLCCSPASQRWRLQLQLNKTSNRDTRTCCICLSPCALKMTFTQPREKRTKTRCSLCLSFSQSCLKCSHIYTFLYFHSNTVEDPFI